MKSEKGSGNPLLIAVVVIVTIVLIFGAFKFITNKNALNNIRMTPTPTVTKTPEAVNTGTSSGGVEEETSTTKTFIVIGANFSFVPNLIRVKKGDTVKITFKNSGGSHDLVVEGYNISTKVIGSGQSEDISFVANKAGTFNYYCNVANHRAMGMQGTLVVE